MKYNAFFSIFLSDKEIESIFFFPFHLFVIYILRISNFIIKKIIITNKNFIEELFRFYVLQIPLNLALSTGNWLKSTWSVAKFQLNINV